MRTRQFLQVYSFALFFGIILIAPIVATAILAKEHNSQSAAVGLLLYRALSNR